MFGDEYGQVNNRVNNHRHQYRNIADSIVDENGGFLDANQRNKTATSSQRTLRYNDFELVQKQAQEDPNYAVHLDEADDKDSDGGADKELVQYPSIKM